MDGVKTCSPPFLLVIRPATYEEVKAIKLVANSHETTKHFSHPAYCNRMKFEAGDIIAAYADGVIVGFMAINIKKTTEDTELDIIGVAEEWRSRGVGKQLLDYLSRSQPNSVIWLNVHKTNEKAISFYRQYGFEVRSSLHQTYYRMRYVCKPRGVLF